MARVLDALARLNASGAAILPERMLAAVLEPASARRRPRRQDAGDRVIAPRKVTTRDLLG